MSQRQRVRFSGPIHGREFPCFLPPCFRTTAPLHAKLSGTPSHLILTLNHRKQTIGTRAKWDTFWERQSPDWRLWYAAEFGENPEPEALPRATSCIPQGDTPCKASFVVTDRKQRKGTLAGCHTFLTSRSGSSFRASIKSRWSRPAAAKASAANEFLATNHLPLATRFLAEFTEETGAVRNRAAEIFGDGLAHVGERRADTEIGAARARPGRTRDRDVLARMIRRRIHGIGIATVIGGDQQQVGRTQSSKERAKQRVKFLERTSRSLPRPCDARIACRNRRGLRKSVRATAATKIP